MKMSVRPELTTAPPARVRDMRHTDGAVDNSALLPNHPGSTYKSGNAVQTAGATSDLRTTRVESSQVLADNLTECLQKIRASVSGLSVWRRSSSQRSDKRFGHTLHSDHHCQVYDADIVRNCNANFRIRDLMRLCRLHFLNPQFS